MLMQPTIEKLHSMKLFGMAEAIRRQTEDPEIGRLSFEERLALLVDHQWDWRQNKALVRRLKNARFKLDAAVEDIDYRHPRRLDRQLIRSLSSSDWVRLHHNLLVTGPCGVGKSYMACALAQKAVRDGFTALYVRAPRLFRDLAVARADGSFGKLLDRFSRIDVLIVDDWAMAPLADSERRDFLEICDDRYSIRSTVLTSQVPISHWHDQIGDPTVADSILDAWFTTLTVSSWPARQCGNPKTANPLLREATNEKWNKHPGYRDSIAPSNVAYKPSSREKVRARKPIFRKPALPNPRGSLRCGGCQ